HNTSLVSGSLGLDIAWSRFDICLDTASWFSCIIIPHLGPLQKTLRATSLRSVPFWDPLLHISLTVRLVIHRRPHAGCHAGARLGGGHSPGLRQNRIPRIPRALHSWRRAHRHWHYGK